MNCFDIMKEKIVDYKKDLEQKLREAFADMKREERSGSVTTISTTFCASKGSCLVIQVPSTKM